MYVLACKIRPLEDFFFSQQLFGSFLHEHAKNILAHQIVTALRVSDDYLRHSTYLVIGHENFGQIHALDKGHL